MIGTMTYEEILQVSADLEQAIKDISTVATNKKIDALVDFISTVEGYSKYLITTVELNQDADEVLKELKEKTK